MWDSVLYGPTDCILPHRCPLSIAQSLKLGSTLPLPPAGLADGAATEPGHWKGLLLLSSDIPHGGHAVEQESLAFPESARSILNVTHSAVVALASPVTDE